MRVAVIGGGISGLAAAWHLRRAAEVTVFEPGRLGGCINTTSLGGTIVELGPDAFLTRAPEAVELCRELGIEDQLVAPGTGRAALWWRGKLRPLPDGLVLGVPNRLTAIARSGILSPAGALRAAGDLLLPATPPRESDTVRELVRRRFGAQVADRLVDPLVGGIHAGWTGELGAAETVPQLVESARRSRSLLLGLRRSAAPAPRPATPVFLAPRDGLRVLVDRLVETLEAEGVEFVSSAVERVRSSGEGQVVLHPEHRAFDAAVVATPAAVSARMLGGDAGDRLSRVAAASVALVSAVVDPPSVPEGLSGFLVPRGQGKAMTACSFSSNKWPQRANPGGCVVRMSAGRFGDAAALEMDDDALTERLLTELGEALGRPVSASASTVSRWPGAFPQYLPGHAGLVQGIERALGEEHPRVALAGSAYRGSGIPACIASGRAAAETVLGVERQGPLGRTNP